jgi:predicted butyrate kinase (DUF1464 family)
MTRVVGIDPGTVSIDVCGLADGQLYLDRSWPTEEVVGNTADFLEILGSGGAPDLVAGPSGYGLPLRSAAQATEDDLRLAFLAPPGEAGGIGGLRGLARQLGASPLPLVYTPGVIHLDTVPEHRKLNRVDLGTADKLCAAALGIHEECRRLGCQPQDVSFILVELGGAFTAALAVEQGQVVDGIGGTSGPLGWRASGALDGEVAFLAGSISKTLLFQGGVTSFIERRPGGNAVALTAYVEGAVKAIRQLHCSAPSARLVLVSGRNATAPGVGERFASELADIGPVRRLQGFARVAKQGAQGAALLADGLAGGRHSGLVDRLRLREARGTVLDHLVVITPEAARRRLGIRGQ